MSARKLAVQLLNRTEQEQSYSNLLGAAGRKKQNRINLSNT